MLVLWHWFSYVTSLFDIYRITPVNAKKRQSNEHKQSSRFGSSFIVCLATNDVTSSKLICLAISAIFQKKYTTHCFRDSNFKHFLKGCNILNYNFKCSFTPRHLVIMIMKVLIKAELQGRASQRVNLLKLSTRLCICASVGIPLPRARRVWIFFGEEGWPSVDVPLCRMVALAKAVGTRLNAAGW